MSITASPLCWPDGWRRTLWNNQKSAKFAAASKHPIGNYRSTRPLTVAEATNRVLAELKRLGISTDDAVISTNLLLRLDGLPRSGQGEPKDPGVAVYWQAGKQSRSIAVDVYDRVADNLAAVAATLEAMRTIERHGGAVVLDRIYMGLTQLPSPAMLAEPWYVVLDVTEDEVREVVERQYRTKRSRLHPDNGGDLNEFDKLQRAWDTYLETRG